MLEFCVAGAVPADGRAPGGVLGAVLKAQAEPGAVVCSSDGFVAFVEPQESFLSLSIRNFGLTLATLGFYSFWARAEARRHLHRSVHVRGQPLDYSGTGQEAFRAFLMGAVVAGVVLSTFLFILTQVSFAQTGEGIAVFSGFRWQRLLISLPLLFLLGSVVYRKRKHVLRRTWIGAQNFDLSGQPWSYAVHHFWTAFLVPITLGWAAPWRANFLEKRKVNEMRFGDARFQSVGDLRQLYKAFALLWFGGGTIYVATMLSLGASIGTELLETINTRSLGPLLEAGSAGTCAFILGLGLVPLIVLLLYYRAAWIEHQVSSFVLDNVRLQLVLPRFRFAGMMLVGAVLKIVSLGAFAPVADAQIVRFVIRHIKTVPFGPAVSPAAA